MLTEEQKLEKIGLLQACMEAEQAAGEAQMKLIMFYGRIHAEAEGIQSTAQ